MPASPAQYAGAIESRSPNPASPNRPANRRKWLALGAVAGIVGLGLLLWAELWPFQQRTVTQNLHEASDSEVRVRAFHRTYFPSPGCVLEGVEFYHGSNHTQPLITAEKVVIKGSYVALLARRLSSITAEKLHIVIPPFGGGETFHTTPSKITIDEIVANGAVLEFALQDPQNPPLRFDIHEVSLRDVGWSGPLHYRVKVRNPEPPGEITASGKFGVWNLGNPGQTPISGEYTFEEADLSVYSGIAGMLSAKGKFGGVLEHIDITGSTDTPDFEVQSADHPVKMTSEFSAYVDATKGDTFLKQVDVRFGRTHVVAKGSIAGSQNTPGKTAVIDLRSNHGRIEDLLHLFVKANRPPMSGAVAVQARAEIPSSDEPFLKKLKLQGGFGVGAGSFAPDTQESIDKLSAGARGEKDKEKEDPETVLTDLTGQLTMAKGVAEFSDLSFWVPGAHSRLHGTYNVISHKIDLRGRLRVDTKISNTTTGGKAVLLKMMDPFFKKKPKGEVLPVRISGTYEHPSFGLDVEDKEAWKKTASTDSKTAAKLATAAKKAKP
ncbi:MAG TPA: AsmA-like C-terminal region-containing protein [Candidatus Sulfotelmatobacter sp.]